jgi:hypothetical protein
MFRAKTKPPDGNSRPLAGTFGVGFSRREFRNREAD